MVITDLAVLAYARGFTHWLYSEPVALANALRPGVLLPRGRYVHDGRSHHHPRAVRYGSPGNPLHS